MKLKAVLISLAMFLYARNAFSQSGSSLGIGGFTAIAKGADAVYWNPANLASSENKFQMILYSFNVGTGNNSFSFNSINKYIGDGESIYLTESDKNDILDLINEGGLKFDALINASLFSCSYENFGFGIETKSYGYLTIPKDIYRNVLFKLGHEVYDYSVNSEAYSVGKIKFSYGRTIWKDVKLPLLFERHIPFKEISAGISLSYLKGLGYEQVERGKAILSIADNGILPKLDFQTIYAQSGNGVGMDIGFSAYTDDQWRFGLVFENLLSTINWSKDTKRVTASINFGTEPLFIFGKGQLSDIEMDSVSSDTSLSIGSFSKSLPLNFRMGIAKDFGRYLLNIEFANENRTFSSAIGGRVRLRFFNWFLSIKRGFGNFHWNSAVAFDFKNFYFDLGISSRSGLSLNSTKALFIGSSIRFGF